MLVRCYIDQNSAKTILARECVWNVNSPILNLFKLFLSYMLWPRTSMSICSNRLGSRGESSKETTNIAMCCRWCHLYHRFQSLQDFCCCSSVRWRKKIEREPWLERPRRTPCFLTFAHLGLFLDILGFACLNYVKKRSNLPYLHSNCQPLAWKRALWLWEWYKVVICYFRLWYLLTVFGL